MTIDTETPGAPAATEPTTEVEPQVTPDQAAGSQPADQAGTDDSPKLELPFKLEEIDENRTLTGAEAREFLRVREAQMQAAFTRSTQEVAELRKGLASRAELLEKLESDDPQVSREALSQLLDRFDLELPDDDDDEGVELSEPTVEERVQAVLAERDAAEAQRSEAERRRQEFDAHVVSNMTAFAKEEGVETIEDLPTHVREELLARAVAAPRLDNGLLDFDKAKAGLLANREAIAAAEKQRYLATKDAPHVGAVTGPSGDKVVDLTDRSTRLARAAAVAGRHL